MKRHAWLLFLAPFAIGCGSGSASPDGSGVGTGGMGGGSVPIPDASPSDDATSNVDAASSSDGKVPIPMGGTTGYPGYAGMLGTAGLTGADGGAGTTGAAGRGGTTGTAGRGGTTGAAGTAGGQGGTTGAAGAGGTSGTTKKLFPRAAALLDSGSTCTSEEGATGDRWCAFVGVPASGTTIELYVFNLTRALAGVAISCETATDPNCLRLTTTFDQPVPEEAHAPLFQGDTLVYYDTSRTPYAWRPGMTAGRALATLGSPTEDLLFCTGSLKGTAVMCLRDLATQTSPAAYIESDILAGHAGPAEPQLARVETVISFVVADQQDQRFAMAFPVPGTDAIAWSARAGATGPETLKLQTIGDDASRVTVASDAHDWSVSPDGTRWAWRTQFSPTTGGGTLQTAPYPAGASPVTVMANALQYAYPTAESPALVVVGTGRQLVGIANPATAPTTVATVDTGVLGFVALGALGHVTYVKTLAGTAMEPLVNLFVRPWDAATPVCTLTATANALLSMFFFSADAGAGLWVRTPAYDGVFTRFSDCSSVAAVPDIYGMGIVGDRAILFTDAANSLRYRALGANNTVSTLPTSLITTNVGNYAPAPGSSVPALLYTVVGPTTSKANDGVYLKTF